MIPEYARFYGYTVREILTEYAKTFFTMVNAMNRIKAREALNNITQINAGFAGDNKSDIISSLQTQERGISGIVNEVRSIK